MKDIIDALIKFRDDRNWKQFHTPENLAKSIVLESAELLENFQWHGNNENIDSIKDELADVMTYCLFMCEHYNLDIRQLIVEKMKKNELKYPISKSYGKSNKYTTF
ncbi:MAG TPA: nucleotide pyrophosphohydrolase [Acholeplasmataceae bacterium]|nr:nucleotide pyrophosphohydrolase [Acholeplasmataceae bacterium]